MKRHLGQVAGKTSVITSAPHVTIEFFYANPQCPGRKDRLLLLMCWHIGIFVFQWQMTSWRFTCVIFERGSLCLKFAHWPKLLVTHCCLHLYLWSCSEAINGVPNANDQPVGPSHLDGALLPAALDEASCSASLYSGCTETGVKQVQQQCRYCPALEWWVLQCPPTRPAVHFLQPAGPPLLAGCGSK